MKFKIFMILACSFAGTIDAINFEECKNNAIDLFGKLETNQFFMFEDSYEEDFKVFEKFLECTILPIFKDTNLKNFIDQEVGIKAYNSILLSFAYMLNQMYRGDQQHAFSQFFNNYDSW